MKNKKKTIWIIIAAAALALIVGGAFLLYNSLQGNVDAGNLVSYRGSGSSSGASGSSAGAGSGAGTTENAGQAGGESAGDVVPAAGESSLEPATDFVMYDADGGEVRLADLIGTPIVLNFWASWCPPCREEMPYFEEAFAQYGDEVTFLMVNLTDGTQETQKSAEDFISDQGYTFPVYFDLDGQGARGYQIYYIPDTYFIDRDGNVAAYVQGGIREDAFDRCLEMIMK